MDANKVELFRDSQTGKVYYYNKENDRLLEHQPMMNKRSNHEITNYSIYFSATVGIFAVIINRWYKSIASLNSNLLLSLVTLAFFYFLIKKIDKEIVTSKNSIEELEFTEVIDNQKIDLIKKSAALVKYWIILLIILLIISVIGIILFYMLNFVIGLILIVYCAIGIYLILKYLDLKKRWIVVKKLKRSN